MVVSALGRANPDLESNPTYKAAHLQQTEHPRCASHSSDPVPTSHSTNSKPSWRCFKTSAVTVSPASQVMGLKSQFRHRYSRIWW